VKRFCFDYFGVLKEKKKDKYELVKPQTNRVLKQIERVVALA